MAYVFFVFCIVSVVFVSQLEQNLLRASMELGLFLTVLGRVLYWSNTRHKHTEGLSNKDDAQ